MTNTYAIVIYLPFILVALILFLQEVFKKNKQRVDYIFIALSIVLFGWMALELLYFLLDSPRLIEYVFSAKIAFVAFMPQGFMLMVASFYRMKRKLKQRILLLLGLLPVGTAVISLVPQLQFLLRDSFSVVSTEPLTVVDSSWGPWFYIHLAICQIPMVIILVLILTQHRKLPIGYRASVNIMFAAILFYFAGLILEMTGTRGKNSIDYNLIGVCVGEFLFFVAVASKRRTDFLEAWQRDIFNYIDEAVFIVNDSDIIVDANAAATTLLRDIGVPLRNAPPNKIFEDVMSTGKVVRRLFVGEDGRGGGEDFYYIEKDFPLAYNMRRLPIANIDGNGGGEYIIFTDVTRNRLLIERLRETAGKDILTGLDNRYRYQQLLRELDRPDQLPLSIIIGDVNGLKLVNDRGGHAEGDKLLVLIAEILKDASPKDGYVMRIGGDEFAILLPKCSEERAREVIGEINGRLNGEENREFSLSVALGSATKNEESENINMLVAAADATMYSNKR